MALQDDLMGYIYVKNYEEAKKLIQQNPIVLQAEFKLKRTFLMAIFASTEESSELLDFIRFVFTFPELNNISTIHPRSKNTAIDDILHGYSVEMLKIFIENRKTNGFDLFEKAGRLQWDIINKRKENLQQTIFTRENQGLDIKKDCQERDRLDSIADLLRDATILEAIENDNHEWLERLEISGAHVSWQLLDRRSPEMIAREMGKTKVIAFYEELSLQLQSQMAKLLTSSRAGLSIYPTERNIEEIKNAYADAQLSLIKEDTINLSNALNIVKKSASNVATSAENELNEQEKNCVIA